MARPLRPTLAGVWRGVTWAVRWLLLGAVVGVLAGASSALFLETLAWVTRTRVDQPWLLWLLPLAGFGIGWVAWQHGRSVSGGNNLILEQIHAPSAWIPRRMAPLVYLSTLATHLFGGSAGREGTAIQMSGSLTELVSRRVVHVSGHDRRILLVAAIAGGFGAVFGVPLAGAVFGLEVQTLGRMRAEAVLPALVASVVGDAVVDLLGVTHPLTPLLPILDLDVALMARVVLAGVVFGVAAIAFVQAIRLVRRVTTRLVRWPPLRPALGGVVVVALTYAVGTRDYLGLSLPLLTQALTAGSSVVALAFAWKLVFTAITLGSGFQGGEVTPLFVIGATLGAVLGDAIGAPVAVFAAMGFVAVFAGATKTPIACTVMGLELFGTGAAVPIAVACLIAVVVSADHGIYSGQRRRAPVLRRATG
jgi:H+/Cl- antiporter ClcA